MNLEQLSTPALVADADALDFNLQTMALALPGSKLRPHVKAHKCTGLAKMQMGAGHKSFTCATVREAVGLASAGLGEDLLIANEVVDVDRLKNLNLESGRVTITVDSADTIAAAAKAGIKEVLIDVNVGVPRCGCDPEDAAKLADLARSGGLEVRGVMGYEGHAVGLPDRSVRTSMTQESMQSLLKVHSEVGGDLISAGGTGTYDINKWANEIQAGSYLLMDTAYAHLDLPFKQALGVLSTVISVSPGYAVTDAGLKSLGMDHGNPEIEDGQVMLVSDEHVTFVPSTTQSVGDRVMVKPAHVDPTVAYHERIHIYRGNEVVEVFDIDLRGW